MHVYVFIGINADKNRFKSYLFACTYMYINMYIYA